jgi:hypothetical protein
LGIPEAKFKIDVKEGVVELEGKENFVDKHLDKFEEIFKSAIKETIAHYHNRTLKRVLICLDQN